MKHITLRIPELLDEALDAAFAAAQARPYGRSLKRSDVLREAIEVGLRAILDDLEVPFEFDEVSDD